jgi:lauroyl/myristoyl acyltransferase
MARHTGSVVLPAFVGEDAQSEDPLGVRLRIDRPLALPRDGADRASGPDDLQTLANVFESWIRTSPHLWLAWSGPSLAWWGRSPRGHTG